VKAMHARMLAASITLLGFATTATAQTVSVGEATVDFQACEAQGKALLKLDMDCAIKVTFSDKPLDALPAALRPLLRRLACSLPLRLAKKDFYGQWIQQGLVTVPTLAVTCALSVPGLVASEFRSSGDLRCRKSGEGWTCELKMHGTTGLGVIGTQLENYINDDPEIGRRIGRALDTLGQ